MAPIRKQKTTTQNFDTTINQQDLYDSLINHLFLPCQLPNSSDDDYLLESNHSNEHKLLECFYEFLKQVNNTQYELEIIRTLINCVANWLQVQNRNKIYSTENIKTTIERLISGDFLPMYFHTQNAAILIEMNEQTLISAWQVSLPTDTITASIQPHRSQFPSTTYRLSDRHQLTREIHCELLVEFMTSTIEYSKSIKASQEFNEIRDVPISHYICQWWIKLFSCVQIDSSIQFTKKHRDQIRWKNADLPFRRSGLWMTMKVVLQTILTKRLGRKNGTYIYKLLITDFLTFILHKRQIQTNNDPLSPDVLVHCLRKLLRRLNKLGRNENIEQKLNEILPSSNWQERVRKNELERRSYSSIDMDYTRICQHFLENLKAYLNTKRSIVRYQRINLNSSLSLTDENHLPSFDLPLARIEIWIESHLEHWIDRNDETQCFQRLVPFFEEYQSKALKHCYPIGYSRYILTCLTIIRCMHQKLCSKSRFERLKHHRIKIPDILQLFEYLILSNRDEMIRARHLYDYFDEFDQKSYCHIFKNITSENSFGVYFAERSTSMNKALEGLQQEIQNDVGVKRQEIQNGRRRYENLTQQANTLWCQCDQSLVMRTCERCSLIQTAKNIRVSIYECPLPADRPSALAVIFELQMPIEFRCYRDVLWMFINRPHSDPPKHLLEWLNAPSHSHKLARFYHCNSYKPKVKLISSQKSISQTHYATAKPIESTSDDEYILANSLQVEITPSKSMNFEDECQILTPEIQDSNYKDLQFTIDSTQFVQNCVIAEQSKCPLRLKLSEFIEFGSFRSGHRLQWWNLLSILELDSLSIDEESVTILIQHSILQYGPISSNSWCSESHQIILEDHFVRELISRLDRRLTDSGSNWHNEFVLINITIITMRLFTLCNSTKIMDSVRNLVFKCRRTGETWIELIKETIRNIFSSDIDKIDKLRSKIVNIAIACLLTFSTHNERLNNLLESDQHVISLLKAATTVHDNIILTQNETKLSDFMQNLKQFTDCILVFIHPIVSKYLRETSYESLNLFSSFYWSKFDKNTKSWKKRNQDIYDGWYDIDLDSILISIDCLKGIFLINNMTIGFLPNKITSNELFIRVFDHHVFEVQVSENPNTYVTKDSYHGEKQIQYEFCFDEQNQQLIIRQRYKLTDTCFELIPWTCFENDLPDIFVSNYSHWKNVNNQEIEFRPVKFRDSKFLIDKDYILILNKGLIVANNQPQQMLICQQSAFFQNLFDEYFNRLDDEPYVYMLTQADNRIINIYLSRLGLAFEYNIQKKRITSREYSNMYVDEEQWFGTLTGLRSGLLLSPNSKFLSRKLIVPFGQLYASQSTDRHHQIVTIERTIFQHQYFVFTLNDRLRILQSTDSPTGWLYLALLHAITSHPLPDEYTGMTGMERAFQLLNSAGSWSDQPFDKISLNILCQIARLSPKTNYYPQHLTCMAKIDWNSSSLPCSMQHFGYYLLAKKIYETSLNLKFIYSIEQSKEADKLFTNKNYNVDLLAKLYWDYRDSYNPTARLSREMEEEIRTKYKTKPYCPIWINCSSKTNYPMMPLTSSLYANGDVNLKDSSTLKYFPLSRWLLNEYRLPNIWIGLFKLIEENRNNKHEIERWNLLLDFLRYISKDCSTQLFYVQLLKSILTSATSVLRSCPYPLFTQYKSIQEKTFLPNLIHFPKKVTSTRRPIALKEVQDCFDTDTIYENRSFPERGINKYEINELLKRWRANSELANFLNNIQRHIDAIPLVSFHSQVNVNPQMFSIESYEKHYQLSIHSSTIKINQNLLKIAEQKFLRTHTDYYIKPISSTLISDKQKQFPEQIFPSCDPQMNSLSNIAKHFKEQLSQSWKQFESTKRYKHVYPDIEQIKQFLESLYQLSKQLWNELVNSMKSQNDLLYRTGLMLRIVPTTLTSILLDNESIVSLTEEQRVLLGGIMVNWVVEQRIERAVYLANHDQWEDFEKEISNVPHTNWIPKDHIPWLILELEMDITIREIQVEVARHMTEHQHIVMQMNMGEGKTSVIIPMLAVTASSDLVRIIVLKSLFPMNYQSLRYKLGGLLNRRILPFSCRRDMNFNKTQVDHIFDRFHQAWTNRDVIITSPEDVLSFELLTIDKCRRNEFDIGRTMLSIRSWSKNHIRDVLDESDEILHVKYQLIYSIGAQQQVDGGMERWKTIQLVLDLVRKHAACIAERYADDSFYRAAERRSHFSEFRLLSHRPYSKLCQRIANDWIDQKSYRQIDRQVILSFILDTNSSIDCLINRFSECTIQLFLIMRGLLSSEVLLVALKRRYRVQFGINQNPNFKRLMAVPFRAKDVAAENTEFGHPDVAILLTQLAYYYTGLNDTQMLQCFNRLNQNEEEPEMIYSEWISFEGKDHVDPCIQNWKSINTKDYQQRTNYLFPTLRQNMLVVNYFLNHFVFPCEAKQFPYKLVSSPWDLSSPSQSKVMTGFSGTNDTQLLLPIHVTQCDLPKLQQTDAIVLRNLLHRKNENYECLSLADGLDEILKRIVNYKFKIQVILDVGALFINGTNRQIATKWLDLCSKETIDYAVYFEADEMFVCDRFYHSHSFLTSPACERLERCVFYLDEIHTRGTDFKFPNDFHAAVTLGHGLSKDRLVQACMRMRKLGRHHWLSFWSSNEVHQQIQLLKHVGDNQITLNDVLRWVYENTQSTTWDGFHHWATQSLSYQRKVNAFQIIDQNEKTITDSMLTKFVEGCLEPEVVDLKSMYGAARSLRTVSDIYLSRYQNSNIRSSREIHEAVVKRLQNYGGSKKLLAQLLDEEQQRELEQELEQEQLVEQPLPAQPCEPILFDEIKKLCDVRGSKLNLSQYPLVFSRLSDAFRSTTFYDSCQSTSWQTNLWISTEFKRVIETKGELLDAFLRPPRWIVVYRNEHLIFVSPYEANWIMGALQNLYHTKQSSTTTLRLLLPRIKRDQTIFINNPALTMPPTIVDDHGAIPYFIPIEILVNLFIFNGTIYFESTHEQTVYCQCLGLCPKPRTAMEEIAFEKGWITADGFVEKLAHRQNLSMFQCRFNSNPLLFLRKLIELRNNTHAPVRSHVGSIIFNAIKQL